MALQHQSKYLAGAFFRLLLVQCAIQLFFGISFGSAQEPSGDEGLPETGFVLHTGSLYSFDLDSSPVFSRDGRWLAFAVDEKSVQLWDVATGQLAQTLTGHAGRVLKPVFSPDGRWLATKSFTREAGETRGFIKIWETSTGEEAATLSFGHWPPSVEFSADGRLLASASEDSTVQALGGADRARVGARGCPDGTLLRCLVVAAPSKCSQPGPVFRVGAARMVVPNPSSQGGSPMSPEA